MPPSHDEVSQAPVTKDRGSANLASSSTIDDVDRRIIEALQRDGRRPYGAIAKDIGVSEAAVRRRVQRLRDNDIMQVVAVTDPLKLGFAREALVGIRVHGDVRIVADKLAAIDECNYVVMCAGSFDILAEIVAASDDALVHLLNDAIRSIPGVTEVESFLYLKLTKQTFTWGTR